MKIKRGAAFSLFAYGKDKSKYQIRFRVRFNSQRIDLSTGCQVSSLKWWDEENELVKSGYVVREKQTLPSTTNSGRPRTRWIWCSSTSRLTRRYPLRQR